MSDPVGGGREEEEEEEGGVADLRQPSPQSTSILWSSVLRLTHSCVTSRKDCLGKLCFGSGRGKINFE